MENTSPNQEPATTVKKGTSAMAVIGLVFAILALITCLLPIINNLSFFVAIVGAIFAIVGIVQTGKDKPKGGRKIALVALIMAIVSIVCVLGSQSLFSAAIDEAGLGETRTAQNVDNITIESTSVQSDYNGNPYLMVTYSWTNSGENTSDKAGAFATTYSAKVYQDGVECDRGLFYRQGDSTDYYGDQKEVKVGASQTFTAAYELESTDTQVQITVTGWIGTGNVYLDETVAI